MPTHSFAAVAPTPGGSPRAAARAHADTLGVVLSCACVLHCVALPLALVAFPAVHASLRASVGAAGGEGLEWAFVAASAATGVWALGWRGWRVHGRRRPLAWFAGGLGLVLAGHRLEDAAARPASVAVVAGAGAIVTAHARNRRLLLDRGACGAPCCAPPGPPEAGERLTIT